MHARGALDDGPLPVWAGDIGCNDRDPGLSAHFIATGVIRAVPIGNVRGLVVCRGEQSAQRRRGDPEPGRHVRRWPGWDTRYECVSVVVPRSPTEHVTEFSVEGGGIEREAVIGPLLDTIAALDGAPVVQRRGIGRCAHWWPGLCAARTLIKIRQLQAGRIGTHEAVVDRELDAGAFRLPLVVAGGSVTQLLARPDIERPAARVGEYRTFELSVHHADPRRHGHMNVCLGHVGSGKRAATPG